MVVVVAVSFNIFLLILAQLVVYWSKILVKQAKEMGGGGAMGELGEEDGEEAEMLLSFFSFLFLFS